ncbi:hypothetical protein HMPREF0083_04122 [Aneurinibacillus aneurinilyticus ATCC 12856]|uniref:Uncharacterized protein n=1 Tax=Aneurinibacillus aneurinilyticus ATCC 12856 TaxID=649747 RepID=U1WGW6_ANEAE|nr:hypothetical protein HMPREF0083_04122 [Aneurinibacillus aneurinilyticus ATCC 12856]
MENYKKHPLHTTLQYGERVTIYNKKQHSHNGNITFEKLPPFPHNSPLLNLYNMSVTPGGKGGILMIQKQEKYLLIASVTVAVVMFISLVSRLFR